MRRHREYGGSLRRVRCQANGLAYASTLGWMRVEPQQRDAHPTEDHNGSTNLPTSVAERINANDFGLSRAQNLTGHLNTGMNMGGTKHTRLEVPLYAQNIDFTSGASTSLMVWTYFDPGVELSTRNELLWRAND